MHPIDHHARPDTAAALLRTVTARTADGHGLTLVQHWAADTRTRDGWARTEWITRLDVTRNAVHAPTTARYSAGQLGTCRADWEGITAALNTLRTAYGHTLTGDMSPLPPAPYAVSYDHTPRPTPGRINPPRHARTGRHRGPLALTEITDPAFSL